jgi:HK97 family phage prohead protease
LIDNCNDVVLPNAFKKGLATTNDVKIKMLWQHDATKPIGYWTKIKEDSLGLYVEGQILLNTQQGKDAFELVKSKSVSGLSIGYQTIDYGYNRKGQRTLKEIELYEISIVTFPANKFSNITNFKNYNIISELDRLEKIWKLV